MGQFRMCSLLMAIFGISWTNSKLLLRLNPLGLDLFLDY